MQEFFYRRYYEAVSASLFTMAVFILMLGPLSLTVVNYGVTAMFVVITVQQICDTEDIVEINSEDNHDPQNNENTQNNQSSEPSPSSSDQNQKDDENKETETDQPNVNKTEETSEDCVCNENRIYSVFKNLRDKFSFSED